MRRVSHDKLCSGGSPALLKNGCAENGFATFSAEVSGERILAIRRKEAELSGDTLLQKSFPEASARLLGCSASLTSAEYARTGSPPTVCVCSKN